MRERARERSLEEDLFKGRTDFLKKLLLERLICLESEGVWGGTETVGFNKIDHSWRVGAILTAQGAPSGPRPSRLCVDVAKKIASANRPSVASYNVAAGLSH